jgi:hypothetical protein
MTSGWNELYSTDKFDSQSVETLDSGFERTVVFKTLGLA